jgi:hypothetical protein
MRVLCPLWPFSQPSSRSRKSMYHGQANRSASNKHATTTAAVKMKTGHQEVTGVMG